MNENTKTPNRKVWLITARCLWYLAILCGLVSVSLYFLPDLPRVPGPDLGNVYPVQNHGTTVYWTKTELWAYRALFATFIICGALVVIIFEYLGELRWRKRQPRH